MPTLRLLTLTLMTLTLMTAQRPARQRNSRQSRLRLALHLHHRLYVGHRRAPAGRCSLFADPEDPLHHRPLPLHPSPCLHSRRSKPGPRPGSVTGGRGGQCSGPW